MHSPADTTAVRLLLSYAADNTDVFAFALYGLLDCPGCCVDTILSLTHLCVNVLNQHHGDTWEDHMARDLADMLGVQ